MTACLAWPCTTVLRHLLPLRASLSCTFSQLRLSVGKLSWVTPGCVLLLAVRCVAGRASVSFTAHMRLLWTQVLLHRVYWAAQCPHPGSDVVYTLTQHFKSIEDAIATFGVSAIAVNAPLHVTGRPLLLELARSAQSYPATLLSAFVSACAGAGLDINVLSPDGHTASYYAAECGAAQHVVALLSTADALPSTAHLSEAAVAACRFLEPTDVSSVLECVASHDVVGIADCADGNGVTPLLAALSTSDPDARVANSRIGGSRREKVVGLLVEDYGVDFPCRRDILGSSKFSSRVGRLRWCRRPHASTLTALHCSACIHSATVVQEAPNANPTAGWFGQAAARIV